MKYFIFIILFATSGCFYFGKYTYHDIIKKQSDEWSIRDALIVLASPIAHNLYDKRTNIKIMATPYYPSVIFAIQRIAQRINHWTEEQFRINTEQLLKDNIGLYIEWETNHLVDSRGNYFRSIEQVDSLMLLITIENNAWPSYIPDITNLEERIFLVNDKGEFIKPKYVWGKRKNQLAITERMFVMFHFTKRDGNATEANYHFLRGSENMYLIIQGFEMDIKLTLPLSMMK